jgi:hypothetical protein
MKYPPDGIAGKSTCFNFPPLALSVYSYKIAMRSRSHESARKSDIS